MARIAAVEAILRRWDPIGIQPGAGGPLDEYDSYAPGIVARVERGCTIDELQRCLAVLATDRLGVDARPREDRRIAAEILAALDGASRGRT